MYVLKGNLRLYMCAWPSACAGALEGVRRRAAGCNAYVLYASPRPQLSRQAELLRLERQSLARQAELVRFDPVARCMLRGLSYKDEGRESCMCIDLCERH